MWTFRYLALAVGVIFQLNSVVGYASWMQVSDFWGVNACRRESIIARREMHRE